MDTYYETRKDFPYYQVALQFVEQLARRSHSVLDVGCRTIPFVNWLPPRFRRKTAVDLGHFDPFPGVQCVVGDFRQMRFLQNFGLVTCLQTLEHIDQPEPFAAKLFDLANQAVIITVPYKWPAGSCPSHVQDPVCDEKLFRWTGRYPALKRLVEDPDGRQRLVVGYHSTRRD